MDNQTEKTTEPKQRHGCVTAWLIFMIIGNSISSLTYLFGGNLIAQSFSGGISSFMVALLFFLGLGNVLFAVMLLKWKKLGFWGFIFTSICAVIINLNLGLGIQQSLFGLMGIVILYAVLQIKKDDVAAWENLE